MVLLRKTTWGRPKYGLSEIRAVGKEYKYSIKQVRELSEDEIKKLQAEYLDLLKNARAEYMEHEKKAKVEDDLRAFWIEKMNKIWVELAKKYDMIYKRARWD